MPHEFADGWNNKLNQSVELTQDDVAELIKNMKVTVTEKDRGKSTAESIADGFAGNNIDNKVWVRKGMHTDGKGYLHITGEYYFEAYHLYAAKLKEDWQVLVVFKLNDLKLNPQYFKTLQAAGIQMG